MPMTTQQETWLDDQEKERTKFSIEYAKKLVVDQLARALKKKEIDKPKKDDQSKGKGKEMMKNTAKLAKEALLISKNPIKPKYKSASDFMEKNFPNFDREDDLNDENEDGDDSSNCPMRATQLHESDRVMAAFAKFNLSVKESVVRNALLVPQDKPEAICLEQMRNSSLEGLMSNPLKRELWRDSVKKSMKKGGKKKRAKK